MEDKTKTLVQVAQVYQRMLLGDVQHIEKKALKDKYMSEIPDANKQADATKSIASTLLTDEHSLMFDICLALERSAQRYQVDKVFELNRVLSDKFELNPGTEALYAYERQWSWLLSPSIRWRDRKNESANLKREVFESYENRNEHTKQDKALKR